MPSISELVAFEAVARLNGFMRAADELALTQGALSKQIRQFETRLGVQLFERNRRTVKLTEAGEIYFNHVRVFIDKLENSTLELIASYKPKDVITCAVPLSFATNWLIAKLPDLLAVSPGLSVRLKTFTVPFDIDDGETDVVIHLGRPNWPQTIAIHLMDEAFVPVATPAYRDAYGLTAPESLAGATLIHHAARSAYWLMWHKSLDLPLEEPFRGHTFDHHTMIAEATAAGLGAALMPRRLIEDRLRTGEFVVLFDRPLTGIEAYHMLVPADRGQDAVTSTFCDWLVAAAGRS